jgi:hypothetical protein
MCIVAIIVTLVAGCFHVSGMRVLTEKLNSPHPNVLLPLAECLLQALQLVDL